MTTVQATRKLQAEYEELGGILDFDWAKVIEIFKAFMEACGGGLSLKEQSKEHPRAATMVMTRRLGQEMPNVSRRERVKAAEACINVTNRTSKATLESLAA